MPVRKHADHHPAARLLRFGQPSTVPLGTRIRAIALCRSIQGSGARGSLCDRHDSHIGQIRDFGTSFAPITTALSSGAGAPDRRLPDAIEGSHERRAAGRHTVRCTGVMDNCPATNRKGSRAHRPPGN